MTDISEPLEFWRKTRTCEVTSMSPATVDRAVAEGKFPKPVRISRNRVAWVAAEVQGWMAERLSERNAVAA